MDLQKWLMKKWWPDYMLVYSVEVVSGEAQCTHQQVFTIHFKSVHSDWSYECIHNRVDVSERGLMLSGRSEVTPAVTLLCRVQLCTVTSSSVVMLSGHCCTDTNLTQNFQSGILFGSDAVVILLPWLRWWAYMHSFIFCKSFTRYGNSHFYNNTRKKTAA